MSYDIVTREALELAGIETRASNEDPGPIGALWGRFFGDEAVGNLEPAEDTIVAVYCEYDGDHTKPYTFFLGRRVALDAAVPEGLVRRRIEGGAFARFVAEGEQPVALIETWREIWETPLDRTYLADYEIHSAGAGRVVEIFAGISG